MIYIEKKKKNEETKFRQEFETRLMQKLLSAKYLNLIHFDSEIEMY